MRRLLALLGFALAAACSDDGPTGQSTPDVSGMWAITFSNLSGDGVSCSSNPGSMSLTMSGSTFSGSYGPIALSCSNAAGTFQQTLQGSVVNGTVGLNSVSFDLDTQDFHQTGNTNGCLPGECDVPSSPARPNSMSGTAHWTMDLGGGQSAMLSGIWSAVRQ